jgi:hypothetical protein
LESLYELTCISVGGHATLCPSEHTGNNALPAESGAGDAELSPLGPHTALLSSLHESLETEQLRATRAEEEAALLRARIAALEKASAVRLRCVG